MLNRLLSLAFFLFGVTFAIAQPKITINTDGTKDIRVRPGETIELELKVGNYGDQNIDDNYTITASFNATEGFLSNRRYRLSTTTFKGVALNVNEQKTIMFRYTIPEDAPEVNQSLIFSISSPIPLQREGGYLFMKVRIESLAPLPDLVVENFLYPQRQEVYNELDIKFDVTNKGELLNLIPFKAKIYLSKNGVFDENSIFLKQHIVPALTVNDRVTITETLDFTGIPPATYKIIVYVDQDEEVTENNEYNNQFIFFYTFPINGDAFPDLYFERLNLPEKMYIGDPLAREMMSVVIRNQTIPRSRSIPITTPICNQIYLSKDTKLDDSDRLLASAVLDNGMAANGSRGLSFLPGDCNFPTNDVLFPVDIKAGIYYLIYALDTENAVTEYFENNNTLFRRIELDYLSGIGNLVLTKVNGKQQVMPGETIELELSVFNRANTDFTGEDTLYLYQRVESSCVYSPCFTGELKTLSSSIFIPNIAAGEEKTFTVEMKVPENFFRGRKFPDIPSISNPSYEETYIGFADAYPKIAYPSYFSVINAIPFNLTPTYFESDLSIALSSPDPTYDSTGVFTMTAVIKNEGLQDAYHAVGMISSVTFGSYYNGFFPSVKNISKGSFGSELFYDDLYHYWYIPYLAAGETATLELEYGFSSYDLEVWYFDQINISANASAKIIETELDDNRDRITFTRIMERPNTQLPIEVNYLSDFSLSPNPAMNEIQISFEGNSQTPMVSYSIYDTQGRLLKSDKWESFKGFNQQSLNISTLSEGTYYLKAGAQVQRFVVMR